MSSSVDLIKSKIDIVSLINSYVKLEKAGGNFKGRCPFHNEKTPSFFVSPDRGSYYCFGCQAKGDIFTFVQEFEGLDFIGSLKVLAEKAGVKLEQFQKGEKSEKEKLFSVLEIATLFYQQNLEANNEAKEYLKKRGINLETIENFRIGFAPEEWRNLYNYLLAKNISAAEMLSVGLIKRKEGTKDSYYDTFRGRIIFPISDSSGRVVGFSGRALIADDKTPKYLNSPETTLFNKSEILFGLDKAKKDVRLKDYSILVEGQMDLVSMHQAGITNTVASSGTALTIEHLTKLRRLSNRIIFCYDGDSAGFSASNRGAQIALSLGLELKIASMPKGKDPADLAKDNVEELRSRIGSAKHIIDFYTDSLLEKNLSGRDLGQEIRKNVLPYVALLSSSIEKDHFIKNVAKKTFIKEESLWDDLKGFSSKDPLIERKENGPPSSKVNVIERKILGILWWQKGNKREDQIVDVDELERKTKDVLGDKLSELTEKLKVEKETLLFETESYYNNKDNLKREIDELLLGLEEEYLKIDLSGAMLNLQRAEQIKDSSKVLKFLEDCHRLTQKINTIKTIKNSYEKG